MTQYFKKIHVKPPFDDEEGELNEEEKKLLENDNVYDWDEAGGGVVGEEVRANEGERLSRMRVGEVDGTKKAKDENEVAEEV